MDGWRERERDTSKSNINRGKIKITYNENDFSTAINQSIEKWLQSTVSSL